MYQIPELLNFPNLIHGFSTKGEGNMSYEFSGITADRDKVLENRKKFLSKLELSLNDCVCLWVEHKDKVVIADRSLAGKSMRDYKLAVRADGLLTNEKGLYLFLLIADCLPVILYDPKRQVVGVLHVGWRNADINTAGKMLKKLGDEYGCSPSNVIVGFGPAALKNSFIKESPNQVGDPKWRPFLEKVSSRQRSHPESFGFAQDKLVEGSLEKGRKMLKPALHDNNVELYKVDFVGLCRKQLIDAGVKEKNIFESGIDTIKDTRFFSHFRDAKKNPKNQGRFACVVGRV